MSELRIYRLGCWSFGIIALAIGIIGFSFRHHDFLIGYLEGYLLVLGLTLGCLGIWMMHALVGGQWGDPIGRIAQAGARTLPLVTLLFAPVLIGMDAIFPWTDRARMLSDEVLAQKLWYLSPGFFIGRAILFFFSWLMLLWGMVKRSPQASNDLASPGTQRLQNWAGGGSVLLFFTASFALVDWVLSLETHYYSTIWSAMILMGELLGTFAFLTLTAIWLDGRRPPGQETPRIPPEKLNDLGNLILMSVILWIYMTFSQYLITWSGQIKAEVSWYNAHFIGGWQWFGGALLLFNFGLPLFLLLFRPIKRNRRSLGAIAATLLVMQWVYVVWLIGPSIYPMVFRLSWLSFVVPSAIAAIWGGTVLWFLERGVPGFARGHVEEVAHYAA